VKDVRIAGLRAEKVSQDAPITKQMFQTLNRKVWRGLYEVRPYELICCDKGVELGQDTVHWLAFVVVVTNLRIVKYGEDTEGNPNALVMQKLEALHCKQYVTFVSYICYL